MLPRGEHSIYKEAASPVPYDDLSRRRRLRRSLASHGCLGAPRTSRALSRVALERSMRQRPSMKARRLTNAGCNCTGGRTEKPRRLEAREHDSRFLAGAVGIVGEIMSPRCLNWRQAAEYCGCGSLSDFEIGSGAASCPIQSLALRAGAAELLTLRSSSSLDRRETADQALQEWLQDTNWA
jgi:hypothetical protein